MNMVIIAAEIAGVRVPPSSSANSMSAHDKWENEHTELQKGSFRRVLAILRKHEEDYEKLIPPPPKNFKEALARLLNSYSQENGSNTPDFILSEYLEKCLDTWNQITKQREQWYGKELRIGGGDGVASAQVRPDPKRS